MPSHLAVELLRLFAQGELSGVQVQALAMAAWKDNWGRLDPLAAKLKGAGAEGKLTGNIARDIMRAAGSAKLMCSQATPYVITLPDGKDLQVFLPHEVYPRMVRDGLDGWCHLGCGLHQNNY